MGRPIGSPNRTRPFADMLRVALLSGDGRRLRIIAEKLAEKAEQGDLQAIQQIADRLDGKCAQTIERGDVTVEVLSDAELYAIAGSEPFAHIDETNQRLISPPLAGK